jgi:uncharacterized protein (TIGR01619 family)
LTYSGFAQEGNWDTYLLEYRDGPGSTMLDMDLAKVAPISDLTFRLVTGVSFNNCDENGFPNSEEYNNLYQLSNVVDGMVSTLTSAKLVGTYTYQCERLDYFYISDTTQIRNRLSQLYDLQYPHYEYSILLIPDPDWNAYFKFLYPSEGVLELMNNQKVIQKLGASGDDLSKARKVNHFLYFENLSSRNDFLLKTKSQGFQLENINRDDDIEYPFKLQISRIDFVDLQSISKVTLNLVRMATEHNGIYDGWETHAVK